MRAGPLSPQEVSLEVTRSLLVAMIYVMVLSLGIGALLAGLARFTEQRHWRTTHPLQIVWLVLLLLLHLDLFWDTLVFVEKKEWLFPGFLYVVTGPIVLFFATHLMMAEPEGGADGKQGLGTYLYTAPQFFGLLALLELWIVGLEHVLGVGTKTISWLNIVLALMLLTLAIWRRPQFHIAMTSIYAVLFVAQIVLRGLRVPA